MEDTFSVINKTKSKLISLPFLDIKNDILGKKYNLSLAFIGTKQSRELNKKYRDKDRATNVLSFPLSKTEGEILICPAVARKEIKKFEKSFGHLLGFLVIHGCLHLKGYEHGATMERQEQKYDQKYLSRY